MLLMQMGCRHGHHAKSKSAFEHDRQQNQTRALPILSTESGVVFERDTRFSNMNFTQTLEPKLMYVYIPYRDQSRLPNFESGISDIASWCAWMYS